MEKDYLFCVIDIILCVKKKVDWVLKWIDSSDSFVERFLAFACIEGIFFFGFFCFIYWFKKCGLMLGLIFFNEFIFCDEGLYCDFVCLLFSMLNNKSSEEIIRKIVIEVVEIEKEFVCDFFLCVFVGMNVGMMSDYIEYVVDYLFCFLGLVKEYNTMNLFDWMEFIFF